MEYGFLNLLNLIGSLGLFIYGMKVMSEGIQKAAGNRLKSILGSMTKNRYLGVFSGLLITTLVQSSSATTVMTVSFVNAGLLSLIQSAGIIMGANVGTTVTAWLVTYFGFKFDIVDITLPIIAIGLPMLFIQKGNWRFWAEFFIGFALLFYGLDLLKSSVPDVESNAGMLEFLQGFTNWGYGSYLFFILIGTLITIIVQSSSASMTITLILLAEGWINFEIAAALVLGENIGTTITAWIASLVGNVHAKRAARIHSMFNIIGVVWILVLFPFFLEAVNYVTMTLFDLNSPLTNYSSEELAAFTPEQLKARKDSVTFGLSTFHTLFNLVNVLLLIGFAQKLVDIAVRMVKPKDTDDEKYSLEYISGGMTSSVELSLMEAQKEISNYGRLVRKMMGFLSAIVTEKDPKSIKHNLQRIEKYEQITDNIELEVSDYLIQVAKNELTEQTSARIQSMLSIINDIERQGDIIYQMSKTMERKMESKVWFTPKQRDSINAMFDKVDEALECMNKNLDGPYEEADLEEAVKIEKELDQMRNKYRKSHLKSIEKGDYNIRAGLIFVDLISTAEKLGDHVINVSEATKGQNLE
ncbi:Na/Pi cotransporter family protein [bacterium SCSIO 12741]|nr:Na/Pi cotransporter family protein [bacterium SCSIO 12741]